MWQIEPATPAYQYREAKITFPPGHAAYLTHTNLKYIIMWTYNNTSFIHICETSNKVSTSLQSVRFIYTYVNTSTTNDVSPVYLRETIDSEYKL